MIFINPKTDFAFKKIFGSEQSKDILISFLNAILYEGNSTIEDLEIINPYLAPPIRGIKDTYLDVKARLNDGMTVIIEMQVLNIEGFEKRILYNAAKAYSVQLKTGDDYTFLNPVIALTITDFEMFPNFDKIISWFLLKEKDYLIDYLVYDIELVFVELPKFNKDLGQLVTLTDKWLYFLQKARKLDSIPAKMQIIPEIRKAFEIANQANLSAEELEELERQEMFIHDQRNAIKKAVRLAKEEAKAEGKAEGIREAKIAIARQLLAILDEEIVSQKTGLTLTEIQQLKNEI